MIDKGFHRRDQILLRIRLEKICARAGLQQLADQDVAVVHREDQYFGRGTRARIWRARDLAGRAASAAT